MRRAVKIGLAGIAGIAFFEVASFFGIFGYEQTTADDFLLNERQIRIIKEKGFLCPLARYCVINPRGEKINLANFVSDLGEEVEVGLTGYKVKRHNY